MYWYLPFFKKQLYKKARDKWGDLQILLLFEEMAELQKALIKNMRYLTSKHNLLWPSHKTKVENMRFEIIEELADVQIMLEQMTLIFGEKEVAAAIEKKIERLEELVNIKVR